MTAKKRIVFHTLCGVITLGVIFLGIFRFFGSVGRIIESIRDFGFSFGYYVCEIFGIPHNITPTVNNLPKVPFFEFPTKPPETVPVTPSVPLPSDWEKFKIKWSEYWKLWATKDNFSNYLSSLGNVLYVLSKVVVIVLPFVLAVWLLLLRLLKTQNNNYDKDSKPLQTFKAVSKRLFVPLKKTITAFIGFVGETRYYYIAWLCLFGLYFNVFTIIAEFVAYYLYFVASFDFLSLYKQVYKLAIDLSAAITFIPLWGWIIVAVIAFDKFRKKIAYATLNHYEMKNRGFINARPIVYLSLIHI